MELGLDLWLLDESSGREDLSIVMVVGVGLFFKKHLPRNNWSIWARTSWRYSVDVFDSLWDFTGIKNITDFKIKIWFEIDDQLLKNSTRYGSRRFWKILLAKGGIPKTFWLQIYVCNCFNPYNTKTFVYCIFMTSISELCLFFIFQKIPPHSKTFPHIPPSSAKFQHSVKWAGKYWSVLECGG